MNLKNIKLRTKLLASFLLVAILTGLVGYMGIINMNKINDADTVLYKKMTEPMSHVITIAENFQRVRVNLRDYIIAKTDDKRKTCYDKIFEIEKSIVKAIEELEKTILTVEGRKDLDDIMKNMNEYMSYLPSIEKAIGESNSDLAISILDDMFSVNQDLQNSVDRLVNSKLTKAKETSDNNSATANSALQLMIIIIAISLFVAILLGISITRNIQNDVGGEPTEVASIAREVANGNLTLSFSRTDNLKGIYGAVVNMSEKLKDVITNVIVGTDNIATASQQISSTAQQLSQGATEQASSTEEVSSSMEEMSGNIQQNTDNAQQTEKISISAAQSIDKVRKSSQESMASIKNIADKITIINDIAFQTNILALNAAVEAARAGEHGRGFAVVAAEVRKLAERSKIAAEEINVMAKNSVKVTEESSELLNQIIPQIDNTAKLVQEIAAASIEQNSGADQVNNAIQQLNQITQQNAAASEELATSAEEMATQTDRLKETISYFQIEYNHNRTSNQIKKENKIIHVAHNSSSKSVTKSEYKQAKTEHPKGFLIDIHSNPEKDLFEKY